MIPHPSGSACTLTMKVELADENIYIYIYSVYISCTMCCIWFKNIIFCNYFNGRSLYKEYIPFMYIMYVKYILKILKYLLYIVFSLKYILVYIVEEFIYTRITEVFDTIINSLF